MRSSTQPARPSGSEPVTSSTTATDQHFLQGRRVFVSSLKFLLVCADSVAVAGAGVGAGQEGTWPLFHRRVWGGRRRRGRVRTGPGCMPPTTLPGAKAQTRPSPASLRKNRTPAHQRRRPSVEPDGTARHSWKRSGRANRPGRGAQHGKRGGTAVRRQPGTRPGREPTSSSSGPGHPPEAAGTSETRAHRDG